MTEEQVYTFTETELKQYLALHADMMPKSETEESEEPEGNWPLSFLLPVDTEHDSKAMCVFLAQVLSKLGGFQAQITMAAHTDEECDEPEEHSQHHKFAVVGAIWPTSKGWESWDDIPWAKGDNDA